ncbi:tandem-95 repeat protein [Comamonas testosteroni]|uniref:Tandem-95 repeat protein n=1 Tax=Comamonas testosteroni TaxID=285 RepID=A0A373FRY0_COMTE|nr:Ig-like domain-containing protein [Comamonas testosteroni]RGE46916.1 tandem-95 repeat protein [Comamonas testosteroni]
MRPVEHIRRSSSRTLALEPRLLFDGAAMVAAQDALHPQDDASADQQEADATDAAHELSNADFQGETARAVALIDARVPHQAELAQSLQAQGVQVHVVQAGESGLSAISNALASARNVSDLHVYAYGETGQPVLGQDSLSQDGLQATAHTDAQWQYYLSTDASIELSQPSSREIVFVSDDTPDWQQLVSTLPANTRVVMLDASRDGVEQIAAVLANEHDIDAIHIISHGSASELQLGTAQLNAQSMQAQYLNALSAIGQSLTADGDILIYGCDFAQGDAGLQAAMVLGGITGADIAASTDPTGAAALGGDWDLELQTGVIQTRSIASAESAAAWSHLLALPTDSGETVTVDEDTTLEKTAADGLLANASDADGDTLTVTGFRVNGVAGVIGSDFLISGVGALLINADGSYRFIPVANFNGSVGLIRYDVSDGGLTPTTSTLSITVNPVNDAPVNTIPGTEGNVQWTTPEDTLVNLSGLQVSDVDAGSALIEVKLSVSSGILGVLGDNGTIGGVTVTGASTATVTLTGTVANINTYLALTGRLNFNPAANFYGDVKLTMTTTDKGASGAGTALTDIDSRLITVTPRPDAPTGTDKTLTMNPGDVHTFTVADFGFSDADDGVLANNFKQIIVTWVPAAGTGTLTLNGVAVKVNDVITVAQIPNLKYTANGSGLFVAMGFKVVDDGSTTGGGQNTDLTPNKIRVHIPGDDVGAIADTSTTLEDSTASGNVLTNDIAGNGGTLSVKSFTVAGQTYTPGSTPTSATIAGVGVFTMKSNGDWTFTPAANYAGPVPQVTYIAAETVDINMLDTGRSYGDQGLPANSVDPNYVLISGPAGATQPILKNHPWFGWNSISSDNNQALKGTYVYETSFYIPADVDLSTLAMSLIGGADDYGAIKIYVNGVELVSTGVAPGSSQYYYNISSTNPAGATPLQHETNVMRIVIENTQSQQAMLVKDWKLSYQTFDTSTLDITVKPVNDAPAGTDRTETINQNASYTFSAADFGFSDPKDNPADAFQSVFITTLPAAAHGQLLYNGAAVTPGQEIAVGDLGLLVYQSKSGLTGNSLGAFTFQVKDNGGTANGGVDTDQSPNTFKFNIIPLPPVYDADETETNYEDTVVTGNLLNNSSTSAPPVVVLDFTVEGNKYTVLPILGATANITGVGSLQILADGSYTFTPVAHWNGKVPQITYTVRNLVSSTDTSTLDITLLPVNDAPAGTDHTETIAEDGSYAFKAADFGFSDPDDNPSNTFQSVIITTLPPVAEGVLLFDGLTFAAGKEIAVADLGRLVFKPTSDLNGNGVGAFTFQVKDDGGTANNGVDTDQSPNRFDFNITPVTDGFTDADESVSTPEDTPISGNLLTGTASVDGPVSITSFRVNGTSYAAGGTATLAGIGTLLIKADGSYTFTPALHWNGAVPTVTYTVTDTISSDTSTLKIVVTPVTNGFTDGDEVVSIPQNTSITANVLAGSSSVDGPLSIQDFSVNGIATPFLPGQTATIAGIGTLIVQTDGTYTFTPVTGWFGTVPQVSYTVSDTVSTDISTLDITVTKVIDADEIVTTPEDTPISGDVLTGTTSVNGPVSVQSFNIEGVNYAAGTTATLAGIGTLEIKADGSYTFTPAANWHGTVPQVIYIVSDTKTTDISTLDITVTPVTDGFTDGNEVVSTPEDTPISGTVLGGTSSVDGPVSVVDFTVGGSTYAAGSTATLAGIGTLVLRADGSYTFTPAANWHGTVPQVSYTVSDTVSTDSSTLDITVTPVTDGFTDANEIVSTPEDTPISGTVLGGTSSVDGAVSVMDFTVGGSTYTSGSTATLAGMGTLVLRADGSYTFTPAANWHGTVPQVSYTVSDTVSTDSSTLDITVTPVTDGLTDANEIVSTPEDTPISGTVLGGTSSVDGPVSVVDFTVGGSTYAAGSTATLAGIGTLVLRADGSYTFTPAANWHGTVPQVSYTVSDTVSTDTSTLDITVTPVTDGFTDANEIVSTPEDTPISGTVLGGTSSVDGPVSVVDFTVGGSTYTAGSTATLAGIGTLVLRADGSYTFTPAANWHGTVPQVSYTVTDTVSTDSSTLDITVTPVTDGFTDGNETVTTPEDTPISGTVLGGTSSVDGPVSVVDFTVGGSTYTAGSTATLAGIGTLVLRADGSYTFTPAANWHGTVPQVSYTVSDTVTTDSSTLDITVTPVTDGFTDGNETVSTPEDTPISGTVLGGTSSVDGTVSVVDFTVGGSSYTAGSTATLAGIGTLVLRADGSYTFTPAANWHGTVPQVSYTVSDTVSTDTSTLDITVTPVTDGFTDGNETVTTPEDTPISGTVLGGTSSVDGPVSVVDFTVGGSTYTAGSTATLAGIGSLVLRADGSYAFTPAANWHGTVPQVSYTVSDTVSTDTSTLDITVTPVTDGFTDANEVVSTPEDTPISGTVLGGTSSVDGAVSVMDFTVGGSTYAAGSTATLAGIGTLVLRADGSYTFTPAANWHGTVPQVSYTVSDTVSTDISTLDITVTPVTDGFTDGNEVVSTPEDTPISGTVLGGTSSVDGPVSVVDFTVGGSTYAAGSTATIAGVGTLVINADGSYTFTPAANWHGTAPQVSYTVSDTVSTDTSTLDITVTPVTDGFTDGNETVSTPEDTPISGTVLGGTSSVDGLVSVTDFTINGNTYAAGSTATIAGVGMLVINTDGSYTFTPVTRWNGQVPQVRYTVSDSISTDTSTLDITVTPVNAGPVADHDAQTVEHGATATGNVLGNDSDPDGDALTVTGFTINGQHYSAGSTVTIAGVGQLSIAQNGDYRFVPVNGYSGSVPTAGYVITDGELTATANLDLKVKPSEVAPVIQVIIPPSPYLPAEPPPPGWPVVTQSLGIGEWVLKTVQNAQQEQQMQAQVSDPRVLETLNQLFSEPSQSLTPQVIQYVIYAVRDSQYQAAILKAQASDSRQASLPAAPSKPRGDTLPDWLIKEIENQIQSVQEAPQPPEAPVSERNAESDREELVAQWLFAPDSGLQQDMQPPAMAGGWASSLSAQLRANASRLPGQRVLQA